MEPGHPSTATATLTAAAAAVPPEGSFVPLSFGQQEILITRAGGRPGLYNQHVAFVLDPEPVDTAQVEKFLRLLQVRYDAFRTRLVMRRGKAGLAFYDPSNVPPIDLTTAAPSDLRAWTAERFPRGSFPMVRALLRRGRHGMRLHIVVDHLAFDGWSIDLLRRHGVALWKALAAGEELPATRPAGSFRAYLETEAARQTPEARQRYKSFWADQLGREALLAMPQSSRTGGHRLVFDIPERITSRLPALRKRLRATDFCIFLSALVTSLLAPTGQRRLVVYSIAADRDSPSTSETLGCLINHIGIPVQLGNSFEETVASCRVGLLTAMNYRSGPFHTMWPADDPGALVFAQPHYFEDRTGSGTLARSDLDWIIEPRPDGALGDISFAFHQSRRGYGGGLGYADALVSDDQAIEYVSTFLGILERNSQL